MTIKLIDTLKQKNNGDFGIADANDIIGGYYQVDFIAERDNIPLCRRKEGMLCWVKNIENRSIIYQLISGIGNENWQELKIGSDFSGKFEDLINIPDLQYKEDFSLDTTNKLIVGAINEVNYKVEHLDLITLNDIIHEGTTEPLSKEVIWFDKRDLFEENEYEITTNNPIIKELMNIVVSMGKKISILEEKIEYLMINGGGGGVDPPIVSSNCLILEDGSKLLFEDGSNILLEEFIESNNSILLEDGNLLLLEDGNNILLEE